MIEIIFFALVFGVIGATAIVLLGLPENFIFLWFIFVLLLLVPGLYAAFAGGPFVPSNRKRQKTMLKLANLTGEEVVYDLGCGDTRFLRASAPKAKKAIGYELSIPLVLFGKLLNAFNPKIEVQWKSIWKQDYKDADVIFCYLLPKTMDRFYTDIWPDLKPGTRVISNAFQVKEVEPIKVEEKVYLYER